MTNPADIARALSEAQRLHEDLTDNWDAFCSGDPPPHPRDEPDFPQCLEAHGFVELVPVDDDALEHPFASEIGLEPGGMMWQLTPLGLAVRDHLLHRPTSDASTDRNQATVGGCGKEIET